MSLEAHLSIHLKDSSRYGRPDECAVRAGGRSDRALNEPKRRSRRNVMDRVGEVGVIEDVVRSGSDPKVHPFANPEVLTDIEVAVEVFGATEGIPALVAETGFRSRRSELGR